MIVSKPGSKIRSAARSSGRRLLLLRRRAARSSSPPEQHFYDQHIQPILNNFCVGNTSPCHTHRSRRPGTALGNLDLSSFEAVQKRRDVLRTYGSYPQPLLLLKALPPRHGADPLSAASFYHSEIQHTRRQADRAELRRLLRAEALARQRRQPRRARARRRLPTWASARATPRIPPAISTSPIDTTSPAYQAFIGRRASRT